MVVGTSFPNWLYHLLDMVYGKYGCHLWTTPKTPFEKRTGSHTPMAHSDCNTDKTVGSFISIWEYRLSRGEGFETSLCVGCNDVSTKCPKFQYTHLSFKKVIYNLMQTEYPVCISNNYLDI